MAKFTTGPIENVHTPKVTDLHIKFLNNSNSTATVRGRVFRLNGPKVKIFDTGNFTLNSKSSNVFLAINVSGADQYEVIFTTDQSKVQFSAWGFDSRSVNSPAHRVLNSELTEL
ncbi:hypothetical protein ASG98_17160 [Bacillus sp. Soil531]|uniref:hypothetical protein n=1 Tax=Priestia megaterium TaxID=1404 RepID=UPI000710DA73|nr:hypothetical protein [Priestia megaterium]KRF47272.1 hypothetical protein ASG98_17160 [Bacillus sp. Soil531]MBD8848081.1 hypothetical protein [Priestia megaterium]